MSSRIRPSKVTKADLARTVEVLKAMGARIAVAETMPGKIRIITTDGADLNLGDGDETLDRELREFRAGQHGHG